MLETLLAIFENENPVVSGKPLDVLVVCDCCAGAVADIVGVFSSQESCELNRRFKKFIPLVMLSISTEKNENHIGHYNNHHYYQHRHPCRQQGRYCNFLFINHTFI